MNKIDRDIRNALKDTPTISPDVNRELAQKFAQENYQRDTDETGETLILPVERHRKPTLIKRVGAFAACFTAIAVLGGGAAAMSGLFSPDNSSTQLSADDGTAPEEISQEATEEFTEEFTEETTEAPEEEATDAPEDDPAADYPENTYDMSTKEGIFAKMLNSKNFYDNISGKYVTAYCPQTTDMSFINTYQYDVKSGKSYSYLSCLNLTNSLDDILSGSMPEGWEGGKFTHDESYCDGEKCYSLNVRGYQGYYWLGEDYVALPDTINVAQLLETLENDPVVDMQQLGFGATTFCSNPNKIQLIVACLSNFENWDFEPTSTEYGDAVLINGTTVHYERFDTPTTFSMTVDCATGLIISYTDYDDQGNLYDYLVTHDLKINENAEPVPEIDMNDYVEYDEQKHANLKYEFKTNSSGKTYADKTVFGISKSSREFLPDYLAFGDGYIDVDEFIETNGDMSVLQGNDYHQYTEPSETEELVYKLNLYDCEGNYIYSIYYYEGYIDQ
ncbi:MAG: hypothetical protein J6B75_07380 [Ruminococcus sp.]|nr:hypothetical protein [Ruminococcus sp.]